MRKRVEISGGKRKTNIPNERMFTLAYDDWSPPPFLSKLQPNKGERNMIEPKPINVMEEH